MKKLAVLFLSVVMLLVFFTSCAAPETTSQSEEPATEQEVTDAPVTLSFSGYLVTGDSAEAAAVAFDQVRTQFLVEHPNVEWEEDMLAHDQYSSKIIVDANGGNLPDIFMIKAEWMDNWVENEYVGTINDFIDNDPEWAEGFAPNVLSEFTRDGNIYGVPYRVDTTANLFYNEAILNECGITEFPQTMEEFREAIITIKDNGYIPITAGNQGGWFVDICIFRAFVDRYCGSEWNASMNAKDGVAKFTDPEFIAALKEFEGLVQDGAFNEDINSIDFIQGYANFYQGEAAMLFDGSGGILPHTKDAPQEIVDVMRVTKLPDLAEGGKGTGIPGTAGWAIAYNKNIDPEKLPLVEEFMKSIGSTEFANIQAENNGTHAYTAEGFDATKVAPLMNEYNEMMTVVPMNIAATLPPAVLDVMYAGLQEIIIGTTTPEELAADLQEAYDNAI